MRSKAAIEGLAESVDRAPRGGDDPVPAGAAAGPEAVPVLSDSDLDRSLRLAVESMQIGVTITDLNRRILYANRAEANMHGYQPSELVGRTAGTLGAPGGSPPRSSVSRESASSWRRHSINIRKDGTTFPVRLHSDLVLDESGEPVGLVTSCEDVSHPHPSDDVIRQLHRAIEQSPALVVITDIDGYIEYVNPQFTLSTGYTADDVAGKTPRVLKSGVMDDGVYIDLWKTITAGGTWRGEFLNRRKDGSLYWAIASISGLLDDRGVIRHYVGVQEDITARKEMERQILEKNRELERLNQLKSEMVAVTSHDLRSPLSSMINLSTLLQETCGELKPEDVAAYAGRISAAGRKLSAFIGDILDTEKLESGRFDLKLRQESLKNLLEDCIRTVSGEAGDRRLRIELVTSGEVAPIPVDSSRMERVFVNLLMNAVKFSPEGDRVEVRLSEDGGAVIVEVLDHGPGVPEGDLERIFDRYFQVSRRNHASGRTFGVGLGLFISRRIVQMHGGTIRATNRPGGGCCIRIDLPRPVRPVSERDLRVLILSDSDALKARLREVILARGAGVAAGSWPEHEVLTRQVRPQLVFADQGHSMDDPLRRLKSVCWAPGRSPWIVSVEYGRTPRRSPLVDETLTRPVSAGEVLRALRGALMELRKTGADA